MLTQAIKNISEISNGSSDSVRLEEDIINNESFLNIQCRQNATFFYEFG